MTSRTGRLERAIEPHKTGWIIAARLGSPAEPHLLAVFATRYDAHARRMELTRASVVRVETVPGGRMGDLFDRLEAADAAAKSPPVGRAGTGIALDLTRSPEARHLLAERVPEAVPVMVTRGVRDAWSLPYRLLGRLTLLSSMSAMIPRQQLAVAVPEASDDPRRLDRAKVREVLAQAQAAPPRLDEEELALGGSVEDDAALVMALGAWWAAEGVPDPWAPPVENVRHAR